MRLPNNPNNDANLTNLIIDGVEVALDALVTNDLIKQVPVFGSIAKTIDALRNAKDYLLQRKIYTFIEAAKIEGPIEGSDFLRKLNEEQNFSNQVGANLLLVLDQLDDVRKPRILGIAFLWLCQNKLTYGEFKRAATGIKMCLQEDLDLLAAWTEKGNETAVAQWGLASQSLIAAGFLFMMAQGVLGGDGYEVSLSDLGRKVGDIIRLSSIS